jgi:hypothetical protein
MKVEILEKVGEITIAQVRTAEENKAIAIAEKARLDELARLAELQREQELMEKVAKIVSILIEEINQSAESGKCSLHFSWSQTQPCSHGVTWQEWDELVEKFTPILEQLGYKIYTDWYSSSWRAKSGKIGYASINW